MISWLIWGALLLLQNAAFTMVSRARNSGSLVYHGVASVLSNGVWFISNLFLIDKSIDIITKADFFLGSLAFIFYVGMNLVGGLITHWLLLNYVENKIKN